MPDNIPLPFPLGREEPIGPDLRSLDKPSRPQGHQSPKTNLSSDPFKQVLYEKATKRSPLPSPQTVTVQAGDTLSDIVHRALNERGMPFSTADLYRCVNDVAQANGLADPDLIYTGQRIDLSILFGRTPPEPQIASIAPLGEAPLFDVPLRGEITSEFGMRIHPLDHVPRFHHGVDIAAPVGIPIRCPAKATVVFAGQRGGYGNCVDLDHGDGWLTRYAHLAAILVDEGQSIGVGQEIGTVGESGRTTGPHLHLELHRHGRRIDPLSLIPLGGPSVPSAQIASRARPEDERET